MVPCGSAPLRVCSPGRHLEGVLLSEGQAAVAPPASSSSSEPPPSLLLMEEEQKIMELASRLEELLADLESLPPG